MVLIMSKYIPKVGEAFEYCHYLSGDWIKCGEVKAVTELQIAFIESDGLFAFISRENEFRPIKTKADVEREQLEALLDDYVNAEIKATVYVIQKAGFTIPKKVKRSEISMIISRNSNYCKNPMFPSMLSGICELLGDLVEQDIGGAE
tara:strand:+ start:207 stop:647 length:441 start_codon:yes stop_codon:yes gene_type:complete